MKIDLPADKEVFGQLVHVKTRARPVFLYRNGIDSMGNCPVSMGGSRHFSMENLGLCLSRNGDFSMVNRHFSDDNPDCEH